MLSPLFWLSVVVVFLGVRWIGDGMMALASVAVRRVDRPERMESATHARLLDGRDVSSRECLLDEAA